MQHNAVGGTFYDAININWLKKEHPTISKEAGSATGSFQKKKLW